MNNLKVGDAFAALSDANLELLQAKMASISRGRPSTSKQWKTDRDGIGVSRNETTRIIKGAAGRRNMS
jgi:hypothetical protein